MATTLQADKLEVTLTALKRHGFDARLARDDEEAKAMVLGFVPPDATVGVGDSATLRQIGAIGALQDRGPTLVNAFTRELAAHPESKRLIPELLRKSLTCDVFVSGTNAVTEDGKLVSVDGMLDALNRLRELRAEEDNLSPKNGGRDLGRRPTRDEDPLNAFLWKCHIQSTTEGRLSGQTVALKDHIGVAASR